MCLLQAATRRPPAPRPPPTPPRAGPSCLGCASTTRCCWGARSSASASAQARGATRALFPRAPRAGAAPHCARARGLPSPPRKREGCPPPGTRTRKRTQKRTHDTTRRLGQRHGLLPRLLLQHGRPRHLRRRAAQLPAGAGGCCGHALSCVCAVVCCLRVWRERGVSLRTRLKIPCVVTIHPTKPRPPPQTQAYDEIPWDDLRYMFGEVFYGGHITDAMDRRCCTTYLQARGRGGGGGARARAGASGRGRAAARPRPAVQGVHPPPPTHTHAPHAPPSPQHTSPHAPHTHTRALPCPHPHPQPHPQPPPLTPRPPSGAHSPRDPARRRPRRPVLLRAPAARARARPARAAAHGPRRAGRARGGRAARGVARGLRHAPQRGAGAAHGAGGDAVPHAGRRGRARRGCARRGARGGAFAAGLRARALPTARTPPLPAREPPPPTPCAAPSAGGGAGGGGEAAVRAALADFAERLPPPLPVAEIEGRVGEKTPYVVVALQEARRRAGGGAGGTRARARGLRRPSWLPRGALRPARRRAARKGRLAPHPPPTAHRRPPPVPPWGPRRPRA